VVTGPGTLDWTRVTAELVAAPVATAVEGLREPDDVLAAAIDAEVADTAAFCDRYAVKPEDSANCVIIAGRRADSVRYAACVILATTRADVNGVVRRYLDARKASFAPMDDAVRLTGMEYGGITPIGLPPEWPVLLDAAVMARAMVVIGSGLRRSKIALPPQVLAALPSAAVIEGLAAPAG
jgi:prolyl-tRNA editing enzyme YbaK/EbsC (Cys-tRNA(Pro) deacylase)